MMDEFSDLMLSAYVALPAVPNTRGIIDHILNE
jgi:hypothetical protein